MSLLRKVLLGALLATGVVTGVSMSAPPAQAAPAPVFDLMFGVPGTGEFPYGPAWTTNDPNDEGMFVAEAILQQSGWATLIVFSPD